MTSVTQTNAAWIALISFISFSCIQANIDYCFNSCDNLCDWQCYLDNYQDLRDALGATNTDAAKKHYYKYGKNEGRNCECQCDWQCYLDTYKDLQDALGATNTGAARNHWHQYGQKEGRKCGCCNWQCYLDNYDDLRKAFGDTNTASAESHWYQYGKDEGRNCQCECSWDCYLENYNDLQNALGCNYNSARNHWHDYGQLEGRNCKCSGSTSNSYENYAIKFAPVLKFDGAAKNYGYPMNAQTYINNGGENKELNTNSNPTYWRASICCNGNTKTLKIVYWWWYGYQHACDSFGNGEHDGDWERIVVHINGDKVQKVTYHQHGGYYTAPSSDIYFDGDGPIVYVGKASHGSYYDPNDFSGGCGYFDDYRDPEDSNDYLYTKNNLISLDGKSEGWMQNPDANNVVLTCCPNPLIFYAEDICNRDGCNDVGCQWRDLFSAQSVSAAILE